MTKTPKTPVYCLGWTAAATAPQLWDPKAPKSYKNAEAIAAWIEEHVADTPILPFVGEPMNIVMLDPLGVRTDFGRDLGKFMQAAIKLGGYDTMPEWGEVEAPKVIFAGFNVKQLFASTAMTLLREKLVVPLRFWRSTPGLVDLNDLLIPGALRNGFDIGSLLGYIGEHEYPQFNGPGQAVLGDAAERAMVAQVLAKFAQLA